jgi:murein DD-endopeptidase MepM/ murein hydrolase activator NlpD
MKKEFSRRDFLKTSSAILAASFLAACGRLSPPTSTPTAAVPQAKENPPRLLNPSPNPTFQTHPPTAPVITTNSSPPRVLNSPLDDAPEVFMNTYYGAVGASPPSPQNPKGIHQGMDFVAPTGTPIKAAAPGTISRIMTETKTEYDGTVNTYANVFLDIGGRNSIIYIFEPLQNLFVTEGQVVNTGDILGTLADNRGQNLRGTKGTGTLDFGLMSLVDGGYARICFVPYSSSSFRTLMETWFSRAYTATTEHPGPCTCHYHYP